MTQKCVDGNSNLKKPLRIRKCWNYIRYCIYLIGFHLKFKVCTADETHIMKFQN